MHRDGFRFHGGTRTKVTFIDMQTDADNGKPRAAAPGLGGARTEGHTWPYLGEGRVEVALQLVPLVQGVLQPALRGCQGLLTLPEGLQQLLPLIQHVHHQLLEVGVSIGAMGGPQGVPLVDCGHDLAHGGAGPGLLSVGGQGRSSRGWHPRGDLVHGSRSRRQASGQVGRGLAHGISRSGSERGLAPGAPLCTRATGPGLTSRGWGWVPGVPRRVGSSRAWP